MNKKEILKKIEDRTLTAGMVGLGYVGLPLSVEMARAGFRTIGFDLQQKKVDMVNSGNNYIRDVSDDAFQEVVKSGRLTATSDLSRLEEVDFVAVCVPTPLDEHQQPDLRFVRESAISLGENMHPGMVIALESTTYPGTTEEFVKPILEQRSGLKCGEDFYLGFSPERIDPGNPVYMTRNTPKVVGAIGQDASDVIAAMYRAILVSDVITVSGPAVAEMEKLLENTYRNINIGLINEMGRLCHEMDISIWEVIDAAKTKPYGFQAFYPGPGLGGHCIPLDPYYLSWKAREYGFHTTMIENSMVINDSQPRYCVERAENMLGRQGRSICGAKVLLLGIAYKQNIDDYRESPAIRVMKELKRVGAVVSYYDPYVPRFRDMFGQSGESIPALTAEVVADYDLVIITCSHSNVDYALVRDNAKAVFDTKNVMKDFGSCENVEIL